MIRTEFSHIVEAKERHQPGIFGAGGAYAQSYGIFNTAWAAGSVVGPLWGGYVIDAAGWPTMAWTLGLLCVVSALPIALYTGGSIFRRREVLSPPTAARV